MAAACVFLCGKSEECPRKLEHLVRSWFSLKYPNVKIDQQVNFVLPLCSLNIIVMFFSLQRFEDGCQLIVVLESLILQTIG